MEVSQDIDKLKNTTSGSEKDELYLRIMKNLLELTDSSITDKDMETLYKEILNELTQNSQSDKMLNLLQVLLKEDNVSKLILSEVQKIDLAKSLINLMKNSQEEKNLILCFSCLNEVVTIKLENDMLDELLCRTAQIISKRGISETLYSTICSYVQKIFMKYKDQISDFMHIIPKLLFPPLTSNSAKVREISEKTLDEFPKLVLFAENEVAANVSLKLLKENFCKELMVLFKEKHELYVLKVWVNVLNTLGKTLHKNLSIVTPFFQVIEKGFKSMNDEVCKTSFINWKCLISNFAMDDTVINDSKKLRFVLKPFRNLTKFSDSTSLVICDTWWHLAWNLTHNLSSRFTEVLIPMLEFTFKKATNGSHEKISVKGNHTFLVKRGCHFLLRILEQPTNNSLNRISSPKKLPQIVYPALQVPLDVKVIVHHSKDIINMAQIVIETFGNTKEMVGHIDCLLKSILYILSAVIEDENKESIEAVIAFINLVGNIIESQLCPPLTCLKCIDSLSKLPRSALISHCFHCGPRKPQDILCTSLLKLLVNPYLFSKEIPNKRFLMAYNRLIQAGLSESLNPLLMTQKFINIIKHVTSQNIDAEILFEMWSGIASPLLETIEKTQEVNQGDRQEHDFSCLYDVLLCPFENIFSVSMNQLRTKPVFRLWTNLYKIFVRCASLVSTSLPNEPCEHFCSRLKSYFKSDLLKEPQYFEIVCFLLQVILDSVDFTSIGATSTSGISNVTSMLMKKKNPLGNLSPFVDLLSILLTSFFDNYIEQDEDIYKSCTPKAQRRSNISKSAAPLDLVKAFFENLKNGSMISATLESLAQPLSRYFFISQRKVHTNNIGSKLEVMWNVLTSAIEMHYLGPYDTDFLTVMCPLLESSFSHPRRHIKERSRRFWFATFAPASSSLLLPDSLKTILKKSRLSHMPDEQSSLLEDYNFSPVSVSVEDEAMNFEKVSSEIVDSFLKPSKCDSKSTGKETDCKSTKEIKTSIVKNVDELPSSEFVKIDSSGPSSTTRRRSIRHRKSFVPAMYNDLSQSQDLTLGGSSESFDTNSSCEVLEFKSQESCEIALSSPSTKIISDDDIEKENLSEKIIDSPECLASIEVLSCEKVQNPNEISVLEKEIILRKGETLSKVSGLSEMNINVHATSSNTKKDEESSDVIVLNSLGNVTEEVKNNEETKSTLNKSELSSNEIKLKQCISEEKINISAELLDSHEIVMKENSPELSENTSKKNIVSNDDVENNKEQNDTAVNKEKLDQLSNLKPDLSSGKDNIKQSCQSSSELLVSHVIIKNETPNMDVNIKEKEETTLGNKLPGSQRTTNKSMIKPKKESHGKKQVLYKKNGKSKGNTITMHLKPNSSKANSETHIHNNLDVKHMETLLLTETASSKSENQSIQPNADQVCVEVIDLGDSEDIIPSSQSSGDSMSHVKLPAIEMSPSNISGTKKVLYFDKLENMDKASEVTIVKDTNKQCNPVLEDPNECPETPIDLIETADKDLDEISCQASVLAAKNSTTMPLKSSENLFVSDEHINRPGIKCTLSDVLLETNEVKKMLIMENTPPLFTGAYNVQTEDPLILLDNLSAVKVEEKVKTIVDNKITGSELNLSNTIENVLKEDSPKTVRIKSLRSSAKNAARKSLNTASSKKVPKKIEKRKSMPNLNTSKKCEFDAAIKNTNNEILSDFNKLISSKESSRSCENNLTSENQSEKISHPSSPEMSAEIEQNSILDDINHVLLDIHDKIESYNDVFSLELDVDEKIEVKQDANNLLSSEQHNANKQENLEQKIENVNNSDIRLIIGKIVKEVELCGTNNSELTIQDQNHIDSSSVYENSKIENSSMNIEAKENTLVTEILSKEKVSSGSNISLTNEASFNEIHSVNDISCNNLAFASVTPTENLEESSLKVENKKLSNAFSENIETVKWETNSQLNSDFGTLCNQDLDTHSQEIERELYKIEIIEKDAVIEAPTEYVETCQISEKVIPHEKTSDFQIKIISVASVEEKYVNDSESLNKSIVADEVLDKIESSVKILANEDSNNFSSAEKSQESTKQNTLSEIDNISEKFNGKDEVSSFVNGETKNLNSLENHDEICKITQDSCSSGIEEIQETCEIADYCCLLLKSEEGDVLKRSSLNFPEVGMTENVNINADNSNITKETGNDVSHSDEHSDSYKNKYIERFGKKGNLTKNVFCEASETSTESNQKLKLQLHSSSPSKEDKEMQVTTANFKSMDSVAAQCDLECYDDDEEEEDAVNDKIVDSSLSKNFYTQSDKQIEGSSRKRKTKCPVRSPFNFRQRSNILVSSNKSSVKDNGQNTPKITSKNSKKVMHDMQKKMPEVTGKKFKRHIEPKISINESSNKAEIDNQNASNSSDGLNVEIKQGFAKRLKVECDLQEITDVNTRFNASAAPQTRRLKMLSNVHNSLSLEEDNLPSTEYNITCTEDSSNSSKLFASILKKRKASSDLASLKYRKVTFADPLVEERLFNKNDDLSQRILIVNGQINNREQQTSNTSQDIEKAEKTSSPSMDENPSSSEYENSEETLTDYYAHPICPSLVNCEDSINCIVKDLTTPAWVPGLLTLFSSKNIKTIGDLCKLNPHELKDLPIKSPKVLYLHKALIAHIRRTQEAALKKIKMLGDSDLVEDEIEETSKDNPQPEILKCSVNELANGDKIGQLPTQTLIELSNICFQEVTKRLADQ